MRGRACPCNSHPGNRFTSSASRGLPGEGVCVSTLEEPCVFQTPRETRDLRAAFGNEEPAEAGDAQQASVRIWFSFSRRLMSGEVWKLVLTKLFRDVGPASSQGACGWLEICPDKYPSSLVSLLLFPAGQVKSICDNKSPAQGSQF